MTTHPYKTIRFSGYLICVLLGFGFFYAWFKADQEMFQLATYGASASMDLLEHFPWFHQMMKLSRVDLLYNYGSLAEPNAVLSEFWFQMRVQQQLAMALGLAGFSGLLQGWNVKRLAQILLKSLQLLCLVLALLKTIQVGWVVLTTPRYAPILTENTVDNFLYQMMYFDQGENSISSMYMVLPRHQGGIVPSEGEADIHLILSRQGDFQLGTAIYTPAALEGVFVAVQEKYGSCMVYIWTEDDVILHNHWVIDRIKSLRQKYMTPNWYWVVETDNVVQGHPEIRALPFDELEVKQAF
ncbi:hypothetical protein P3T73_04685 [Kiritimatiellota bacterium B12222]|nr:hypothetical protein P3T73_04685 [Kiritimatiellota bacterium B12222]